MLGGGLRPDGPVERRDLASFLGRAAGLDPAAVVRVRASGGRVTAFIRLPFGVLVSRTVVSGTTSPCRSQSVSRANASSCDNGTSRTISMGTTARW